MTAYVKRCLVVPAAKQALAQALCAGLAGPAGEGMFLTPCSPTGASPATHYISAGMIEDSFAGALADPAYLYGACLQGELAVTQAECTGLLDAADVSEDNPFDALGRLGLKLVQADMAGAAL